MNKPAYHIGLGTLLTIMLGLGAAAFAAQDGPALDAAPGKQAVIEKLHNDFYNKTQATRQQLTSKQYELNARIYDPAPDDSKIQALIKDISELRAKLYEARTELRRQMLKEGVDFGHGGYGFSRRGCGGGMTGGYGAYGGGAMMEGGPCAEGAPCGGGYR